MTISSSHQGGKLAEKRESMEGFSLLELLIVVAIILIVATIAVPSLLRSRQLANENSAVANLRTISNAEAAYLPTSGGFFTVLGGLVAERLLDDRFSGVVVGGYTYSIATDGFEYTATATPAASNTGRYEFYMQSDGVIHYSTNVTLAPVGKNGFPVN